jgi:uncharacterized protein (TIGR00661 family)
MSRIIYGLSGEGSGHSSRSREMAAHLRERGHDLWLVSYDRGYRNLKDEFRVFEIEGLRIASENNKVSTVKTVAKNLKSLKAGHKSYRELRRELFKKFQPDVVITDFEPMTAYLAQRYDLPLITIDNQHRMRYLKYKCPRGMKVDNQVTRSIVRAMVPRPDVSLVISFAASEVRNNHTFVFPPILRREVLDAKPTTGDHTLVYLTSGFESLLDVLKGFTREKFYVYGYDKSETDGVLHYRPFSSDGFLNDLASAKAVIATAGFTLISEALCLRKPYLAFPMRGQFEQQLNSYQLEELGYGKNGQELTAESIGDFFYRLPDYRGKLADYHAGDNSEIKAKLDELLADDCRIAKEFHAKR